MTNIKTNIENNKHKINENRKDIENNKSTIDELKSELRWRHESQQASWERIIHRLIAVIIILIVLLFVSNAVWIYSWNARGESTVINKDGVSNYIGGDGEIKG